MKLLKDLQAEYIKDPEIIKQLTDEFGDYSKYEEEYDEFFNGEYLNQVINESSAGSGHLAGAGPIDYNEGKVLYIWIRVNKPKYILEVGTAAGCSTVIMARALQMNGFLAGYIETADISTDNYEAGISLFRKYVDNGFIVTKFGVDGVDYIKDNWDTAYGMIFIDADHAQKFCYDIAGALSKTFPTTPIFYHEYALTNLASAKEKSYVSFTQHIGATFEREAFDNTYPESLYIKKGFYGSCGLGYIKPKPMNVFYRLSSKNAFTAKGKIQGSSKMECLSNFIEIFGTENLFIQADNCSEEVIEKLKGLKVNFEETHSKTSSESFVTLLERVKKLNDDDLVYIVEDDYLHKHYAKEVLFEGLLTGANYVTGYDHPDKYINADQGGNPHIESGGEVTRVLLTASSHWKMTNSTCLTFLTQAKHIKEDFDIWKQCTHDTPSLGSFYAFLNLRDKKGKVLISSIPAVSTHTESKWLSPLIKWDK